MAVSIGSWPSPISPRKRTTWAVSPCDDVFAARIRVAGRNRVLDLLQRDAVALHAGRVGVDLIALDRSAEAAHVGHARQAAERPLQRQILQRLQIVQVVDVVAGRVLGVRQHVAEDLARGRLRRDRRGDAGGQLRHLQTVEDLLPRRRLIDAVFELVADVAQLEHRLRLRVLQARHPRQGHFQRNRDLAFHFFGRRAGIAGHDFHDGRRRVGIGLHVDVVEGIQAEAQQGDGQAAPRPGGSAPPNESASRSCITPRACLRTLQIAFKLAVNCTIRDVTTSWPAGSGSSPRCRSSAVTWLRRKTLSPLRRETTTCRRTYSLRALGMQEYRRPAALFAQRRRGNHDLRLGRRDLQMHGDELPHPQPAVGIVDPAHHQRRVLVGIDDAADLVEPARPGRRIRARTDGDRPRRDGRPSRRPATGRSSS